MALMGWVFVWAGCGLLGAVAGRWVARKFGPAPAPHPIYRRWQYEMEPQEYIVVVDCSAPDTDFAQVLAALDEMCEGDIGAIGVRAANPSFPPTPSEN
jgi:hypothetical protein